MTTLQSGSAIIALNAPGGNKRLAQGNNNSNRNGTLPSPELNPLINPVLGAHMGRWAEVYFTSPPEKRDEAVLELLRELQGATSDLPPVTSLPDHGRHLPTEPPTEAHLVEPEWAICESCGGRNERGNRFCGMCGTSLGHASSIPSEPEEASKRTKGMWGGPFAPHGGRDRQPNEWQNHDSQKHDSQNHDSQDRDSQDHDSQDHDSQDYDSQDQDQEQYGKVESDRRQRDFHIISERSRPLESASVTPQFETRHENTWPSRPDVPSLIPYEEAPNRRRLYVGAVAGIVILGLVYVAWKGSSGASHTLPQAAPQAAETQPATPDQGPPPASQAENVPPAAVKAPSVPARKPATTTGRPYHMPAPATNQGETNAPAPTSEQSAGPIVASLQGNGSEELTVAESYLNGSGGRARDTGEAAKWLWRSLSKKNGAAALLLSDLYVRGDGVPKSCDQARLLLDAATRKGVSGAAQRLQNLPSLGCE